LKGYPESFYGHGISTDSYAIIELGMVDDLIKDKEGSRRRMLEQAAAFPFIKTGREKQG
jgi:chromosome segregation protein